MKTHFLTKILLLAIVVSSVFPVSVQAATSVTFTTTADFTNNAVVGPDLIAGTADDGTNAVATTSSLTTTSNQATLVGTLQDDFTVITAGYSHTLAIKKNGTLWAWGPNDDGCSSGCGQAGLGQGVLEALVPTQVGTDTNWQSISAGGYESYAIKTNGTLWAWGWNYYGELGLGDSTDRYTPTQVGSGTNWSSVSASNYYNVLAIKTDGTLWAWGYNGYGQLGLGDKVDRDVPTQVGLGTDWSFVSGGDGYSTFAIKTDGTLWAWGNNGYGQLGLGDKVERTAPTQVSTDTHWREVSGNYRAALGLKTDGTLWGWGVNDTGCGYGCGQAGLGQGVLEALVPTQIGGATNWARIFPAGYAYTGAAQKTDGTLWAWGYNYYGQLGLGDFADRFIPTQVGLGTNWQSISSNYYQTLGSKTDGTLWAWGYNGYGQLGLGDKVNRNVPTQVGSSTDWGYPTTYPASSTLSGLKLNAGSGNIASWSTLDWSSATLPASTSIKFRARTSSDNSTYSAWSSYFTQSTLGSTTGTADLSAIGGLLDSQYLELEVTLTTANSLVTPTLNDFSVAYIVSAVPAPVVASGGGLPSVAFVPIQIPQTGFKVSINQDATTTASSQVLLSFTPGSDTTQMAISNLPDFPGIGIEPFTPTKPWLLSTEPGLKTVYVKFYNSWGQVSSVVSDSILLSSSAIPNQNPNQPSPATVLSFNNTNLVTARPTLVFTLTLKLNSKGSQVVLLQNLLKAQGFFPNNIPSNGNFGPTTLKAVKALQVKYNLAKPGLSGYGQVGPATRTLLNRLSF